MVSVGLSLFLVNYIYCGTKGRHQKKNCIKSENGTIGGEGVRKIIEFSSFTNDENHGRGGGLRVTFHYFIEPNYD